MTISTETKKHYRTLGHALKPVVTIAGNGLSEAVIGELNRALDDHELIKIKLAVEDREERKALVEEILTNLRAELIQTIGKVVLILREARKPKLKTSNIRK
jgi:RNA-binding protein